MLPDFNRLKVFYYIYTKNSIVAAAKDLFVTQSAVSQHLQKLEEELSTPLFIRLHKKLIPTAAADKLYLIVKPFVNDLKVGVKSINEERIKPIGHIRVGGPMELSKRFFIKAFAGFRSMYPDVTFYLKQTTPGSQLNMLLDGQVDFAFVDLFSSTDRDQMIGNLTPFHVKQIFEEELVLACSKKYFEEKVLANDGYDNLVQLEFITQESLGVDLKSWFKHHFSRIPNNLDVVMITENVLTAIEAIKMNMGLGVVDTYLIQNEIEDGSIILITTGIPEMMNRMSLMTLQGKSLTLAESMFMEYFHEQMSQIDWIKGIRYIFN